MLHTFLSDAVSDLEYLIEISNLDIKDIKEANHEAIFSRLESKNNAVISFEKNKELFKMEMIKIAEQNPNKSVEELLDSTTSALMDKLRDGLITLRNLNKHYAKSVVAVYEFYNSLLESVIPSQRYGYSNKSYSKLDLLHIEA